MSIRELIPKDKGDVATARKLKEYSYEEIKDIIPDLLMWLQDMNWPVAGPVADYLETITARITPQIITVLLTNDPTWKYWCLVVFGWVKPIDPLLLEEIRQLTTRITPFEIEEGVLEESLDILKENGG
jgi:hypothetical protein